MIATETASEKLLVWRSYPCFGCTDTLYSDFTGAQRFSEERGIKTVVFGTVVTYATLVASAAILWFFDALTEYHRLLASTNGRIRDSPPRWALLPVGFYCNSNENLEKNWLEWLVLPLVSSRYQYAGYLVYDGATSSNAPPSIEFQRYTPAALKPLPCSRISD